MPCKTHKRYATRAEAEAALAAVAMWGMLRGGGSWRLLNVFECGDHFHIGRNWRQGC